jgi:hypothetical protein
MASRTVNGDRARIGARTLRKDRWWLAPLVTVTVLGGFVIYGTWVAFANRDYFADPYLSPFYSPCLAASCQEPTWAIVGSWWPLSPALLVLPFPLGFRLTCYYYRKAYYRSFWWAPPACAVPDARPRYTGETRFPLILQNIHRYFFYLALTAGGSASGPSSCSSTPSSWPSTRCRAIPAGTCAGAGSTASPRPRSATGCGARCRPSTPATCSWPGSAWSSWPWPTCTSGWSPLA